jgi:hypothetical protein
MGEVTANNLFYAANEKAQMALKGALIFFLMAQREAPLCFYFRECQIFPNFFGDAKNQ